ncbi:hypothetical protein A1Q2_04857 [Trichosporon asahii var. asahii CBS 8904]|uniref:Uncharacterized protein n=1 Tax=Trichosporon asahii var. asahii (strain CBS 8904) TaxID=1220162 RepID=K1VN34_TRIAC|nr:hypothetical protein A1Q2_04857 [Trichosporon asahii var. asahii CBS 8904]
MSRHDEREAEAYELTDVEDLDEFEQRHKPRQRTSVDSDENDENIALLASDGEVRRDEVVGKGSKVEQLIDSVSFHGTLQLNPGILYNVLVARPAMYWPSTLVIVQLFTTLFDETASASSSAARRLTSKRLQVFVLIFLATFIYQSWVMRWLGSAYTGLGMMDFSFDWASVGAVGPLFTPYWALGNYFGGLIGMMWIIVPILLVFNFWNARDFPSPTSAGLFNTAYAKFDVPAVLSPDLSLDDAKWETAQPILLTPYFAITYGLAFAAQTHEGVSRGAALVVLHHAGRESRRGHLDGVDDAAAADAGLGAAAGADHCCCVIIDYLEPNSRIGIVAAVSNTTIGLLTKDMAMFQSLQLVSDLKLGWYTSIPPREMFAAQILGTVLGALTNSDRPDVTLQSVLSSKRSYLDGTEVDPTGQWTGRRPQIFYSASIIWGAVGPARFFAGKYRVLYLGFPLGALVPVVLWWAHRRWPGYKLHKVSLIWG